MGRVSRTAWTIHAHPETRRRHRTLGATPAERAYRGSGLVLSPVSAIRSRLSLHATIQFTALRNAARCDT
jgi:hypothetical protein